jgi:hypothetical protein
MMSPNDKYFVVALYGIDPGVILGFTFYQHTIAWFHEVGYSPNKLAVHGKGHSGKVGTFSRIHRKVKAETFHKITGFSLYSVPPDTSIPMDEHYIEIVYSTRKLYTVIAARTTLLNFSMESLQAFVKDAIQMLKPAYGIGYTRQRQHGPSLYAIGVGMGGYVGGEEYERALDISRWSNIGMDEQVYYQGLLRDVYCWNFLTEFQWSSLIDGIPLRKWINEDRQRGNLSMITPNTLLWEVEESHTAEIRQHLWEAGIIFNWRKRVCQ